MGYEIIYHYQEKTEKGYGEETKTFKKRLGDPYEDYPLEELSKSILLQLARRDIYVKDLEVYEITKKKIKYKETKNGIILKNKKYLFSEGGLELVVNASDDKEDKEQKEEIVIQEPVMLQAENKPIKNVNESVDLSRVVKRMCFVPEPQQLIDLLKKGIKLTQDKTYNINKVEPHPNGINEIYTLLDDKGKIQKVSDIYFIPMTNLIGQEEQSEFKEDRSLNWSGLIDDSIPSIRKWDLNV